MSEETIIARIKKLLRLAADKRGNAHEAERALQLAFELAEKHRIEVEGLNLDEESEKLVHDYIKVGQRFDRMRRGVFNILQRFFHVSVVLDDTRMLVVGKSADVQIAIWVHDFLLRAGRDCLSTYCTQERRARRRLNLNKRASFISGFFYGIASNLHNAREAMPLTDQGKALVVSEKATREAYVKSLCGETQDVPKLEVKRHRSAAEVGYAHGKATAIHQPLHGNKETLLLQ